MRTPLSCSTLPSAEKTGTFPTPRELTVWLRTNWLQPPYHIFLYYIYIFYQPFCRFGLNLVISVEFDEMFSFPRQHECRIRDPERPQSLVCEGCFALSKRVSLIQSLSSADSSFFLGLFTVATSTRCTQNLYILLEVLWSLTLTVEDRGHRIGEIL